VSNLGGVFRVATLFVWFGMNAILLVGDTRRTPVSNKYW
jgi:hypothetical protein